MRKNLGSDLFWECTRFFLCIDWIHFQYSCRQSHVKLTHLQVVFQLAFVLPEFPWPSDLRGESISWFLCGIQVFAGGIFK